MIHKPLNTHIFLATMIKKYIQDKQANLWEWQSLNPYESHPLAILGLDTLSDVKPAMIKNSCTQLLARIRTGAMEPGADASETSIRKAQDLLLKPCTRVLCELMRFPPVSISKEDHQQLKLISQEYFKKVAQLPEPQGISCNFEAFASLLLECFLQDEIELPTLADANDDVKAIPVPRSAHYGTSFQPRPMRISKNDTE